MIQFENVSKRYPTGQLALYNVNISFDAGEMVFITGHSGAGKSTFLKLIALLEQPSHGTLSIGQLTNTPHERNHNIPSFRRKIGLIAQSPNLLNDRSVFENVALPLRISGMNQQGLNKRVRAALDKVDLLNKEHNFPQTLSAGERQRVGIARAVVNKPTIILADEPTGNLDPSLAEDIMRTFSKFNDLGATVLVASHDLHLIRKMKKRTIVLQKVDHYE